MSEFDDLLSMMCVKFKGILILGDFNTHIHQTNSMITRDFFRAIGMFQSYNGINQMETALLIAKVRH